MKNLKKTQNGITLIALVITIIVMLLLVAVTVTTVLNGGLFNYAGKAARETNEAIEAEQTLANGRIKVDGKWYESVDHYIAQDAIEWDDNGDNTFTFETDDSEVTIEVGDKVNYNVSGYNGEWRVLGINNGSILLLSDVIGTKLLRGISGYTNGISEVDGMCAPYANGVESTYARSIKAEDINKITGFNPETAWDGQPVNLNKAKQYGTVVVYEGINSTSYKATTQNTALFPEGTKIVEGTFKTVDNNILEAGETIEIDLIYYNYDMGPMPTGRAKYLSYKALDMLGASGRYWLMTQSSIVYEQASWGFLSFNHGSPNNASIGRSESLYKSTGEEREAEWGVRAVVYLNPEVELVWNEEESYNLSNNRGTINVFDIKK